MMNRLFRAVIGLFLFTPWLWRVYQTYKVASKMPPPSIYEAGMIAIGAILLLTLAWTEKWTSKLARLYNFVKGLKTVLEVSGPHLLQDHLGHNRWRFRVHNHGPSTANNVQMRLQNVDPRPKYGLWHADYPYQVSRVGKTLDDPPSRINVGDEEDYEVWTWLGSDGNHYASIDTKDKLKQTVIEPNEVLELKYELTAENADRTGFSMKMSVKDGALVMERKG
jgi:hypothetical protein